MPTDKILFLSFLSISDSFKLDFIESSYYKLAIELGLEKPWKFPEIAEWFKDYKVLIRDGTIGFSHTSFSEAWEYLLNENGKPSAISVNIFSKVLSNLLQSDSVETITIKTIIRYIEYLPSSLLYHF